MPKKNPNKKSNRPDIAAEYSHRQVEEIDSSAENLDEDSLDDLPEDIAPVEVNSVDVGHHLVEAPIDADVEAYDIVLPEGLPARLDPLKAYIREISRYRLLSLDEEKELSRRMLEEGDVAAAKQLVTANLRLVVKIAMEYRSAHGNVMDLIQEGNIGLMKAVSKFDPARGAKLSYYASWWIRSYILKFILDNFRLVKIGTTQAQKKLFYQLMKEKSRLDALGLDAGPKLLADRLNVKEKEVVEMSQRLSSAGSELSLDRPMGEEGGEGGPVTRFQDMLVDPQGMPDDRLAFEELVSRLHDVLPQFEKGLKEKEKSVFSERLMAEEPKTLQEIADKYGLTRERARQIEVRVLEKLREFYLEHLEKL